MHLAQCRRHQLDVRKLLDDAIDHLKEGVRIEFRPRPHIGTGDAQAVLQVFFVADERVYTGGDASQDLLSAFQAADGLPQLGAIIQIERTDGIGRLGCTHAFQN